MADKITTLHPQSDATIDVYPNIVSDNIPSDAVTEEKIKDASVTEGKLASDAVTEEKIKDSSVTTAKLADSSVTEGKLDYGSVTSSKIASGTIEYSNIGSNQIYGNLIWGITIDPSDEYFNIISQDGYYLGNLGASDDRWMNIYAQNINISDSATFVDVTVGHDLTVDGDVKINSRDDIVMSEAEGDTLALSSELTADVTSLTSKIDANSALIDTKADEDAYEYQMVTRFYNPSLGPLRNFDGEHIHLLFQSTWNYPYILDSDIEHAQEFNSKCKYWFRTWQGEFMQYPDATITPYALLMPQFGEDSVAISLFEHVTIPETIFNGTLYFVSWPKYSFRMLTSNDAIKKVVPLPSAGDSLQLPITMQEMFYRGINLETFGPFDGSRCVDYSYAFRNCPALTSLIITNVKYSLDISSTALEHDALVVVLNNLSSVTTTQTLTMGETKLALLSDEEKAIATDKGWTLA